MAYKSSSSSKQVAPSTPWQDKLRQACRELQVQEPIFQLVSDRRGGRTAWSSKVTVYGTELSARFWYDGKNTNNAKEDAAEVALTWLNGSSSPSTSRGGW
ncbi:hypothetical protein QBC34DRAFT_386105 [Podospora aff. communis PSN243]|uniref:DRBM domain-containing protein n=1 Tax=Podospora aff. communis PSN243 TaxID=3040156 RepID=A0AAV9G654_9PEZI|nr:hypothetical protein QBC34DRAFT_386105 [Podospora aff. communis PSN243]